MLADDFVTLQFRLEDSYGDNGVVALVVARVVDEDTLEIESWLMSCRVLGRRAEEATLRILAERAVECGCTRLTGVWRQTGKNELVRDLYERLGFVMTHEDADGSTHWICDLPNLPKIPLPMQIKEATAWKTATSIAS